MGGFPVRIVCPYIGLAYFKGLLSEVDDWRLLTDVNAWIGLYHGDRRTATRDFIERHQDRIRHLPQLHAKCVIGESTVFFGSANLTQTGVAKRDELSVVIDDEPLVRELHDWFERLWSEGDRINMGKLNEIMRTEPTSTTHSQSEVPRLPSSARTVNARIITPLEINDETQSTKSDDDLVKRVGRAPDFDWAVSFLELAEAVLSTLSTAEVPEDDPRLVTSMAQGDRFGVAVNNRYVLGAFFDDPVSIGFILPDGVNDLDALIERSSGYYRFKPLSWEDADTITPHWIEFTTRPGEMLTKKLRRDWLSASLREIDRASGSPYQSSHDSRVYRLMMDDRYQRRILSSAF